MELFSAETTGGKQGITMRQVCTHAGFSRASQGTSQMVCMWVRRIKVDTKEVLAKFYLTKENI